MMKPALHALTAPLIKSARSQVQSFGRAQRYLHKMVRFRLSNTTLATGRPPYVLSAALKMDWSDNQSISFCPPGSRKHMSGRRRIPRRLIVPYWTCRKEYLASLRPPFFWKPSGEPPLLREAADISPALENLRSGRP